ncbi:formate/nitrite transporter family protein [Candidatus Mycobacterium wuenschmannii]|uniref:Formate/nitrite transporter family protein n=1 Tax=Candidatus Mycobacterium wuenschmannii TaxID=3027808 RepID=A0ABY8VXB5_9MYCO|nr:formate/nitrite transporter family protein [Candidatus Mycobacterium wuenschmannii]WIM86783.1 formate/nitrite transporter family protein [Candidatus Mycobacterium wuenschmannii]
MSVPTLTVNGAASSTAAAPVDGHRDPLELFTIAEMTHRVADSAVEKASHPLSFLVRSLVGGAMVAFGVLLSLVVSTGVSTPGIASLLMGLAFGMSFALILVSGMSLITADMAAGAIAVLQRRLTVAGYLRLLAIGMLGNCAGALAFVTVCAAAGGPYLGAFAQRAAVVAAAKTSQPTLTAILLAVVCTWFLQTSMCLFFKARTDIARMGFAFYGPFAFVSGATQHVIANVGFLGLPLLLSAFHNEAPHTALTWGLGAHGLLTNILITTVGNLIGGTLFVAVPFYLVTALQDKGR